MKPRIEVTCVGEAIVDFISTKTGAALADSPGFLKRAGGSAANIAVGLSRLGVRSAFAGRVGHDAFGEFLKRELGEAGVDVTGMKYDDTRRTRLAFVSRLERGEREFAFWEKKPADENINHGDLDAVRNRRSRVVHFSSFLLLHEPARSSVLELAKAIYRSKRIISFDPNLRLSLWQSAETAKRFLLRMVKMSTILRLNREEACFLTGSDSIPRAARALLDLGPRLVVVSLGQDGCYLLTRRVSLISPGFRVRAIDTTGCGDAFHAALLAGIIANRRRPEEHSFSEFASLCEIANAAGAITAMKPGVIGTLPTLREINAFLHSWKRRKR